MTQRFYSLSDAPASAPFRKILLWTPRILLIVFAFFLVIFSFDVFEAGKSATEIAIEFVIHNVPSMLLGLVVFAAWRREWVGTLVCLVLAVAYIAWARGRFPLSVYFIIAGPLFLIAALYAVNWQLRKRTSERQILQLDGRDAAMLLPALMIALVAAVIVALFMGSGKHGQRTDPAYADFPAYADSIVDRWNCQLNDDKTPADLVAASSVWLKAAKSNEGGEALEAFLEFPIEADTGDDDFTSVLVFADGKTWDTFYHDYPNSPAGEAEKAWGEVATCTGASVWASVEIE
jgi:hypothetical protein